jgi:carbamoyl-phosphate synthase large subunit
MVIRVLVSGAGGDVGQGVLKALASSHLNLETYTTCISPRSSWLHKGIKSFIAPLSADVEYIPYLIRLIRRFDIQVFFPTVDSEIAKIATHKELIESETGVIVFVDSIEKVEITDDKLNTSDFLRAHGFSYADSCIASGRAPFELASHNGYPLIIKKRTGRGSLNVIRVNGELELENFLGDKSFMVQEWLDPSQGEYTSGLYLGDDGQIKGVCTFRRELKGGSTYIAERIVNKKLEKPLEAIALKLGMKYLNIQSMRRGDDLVPFEFNGRLSGSTAMVSKVFNAPEMFIRERLLGESLSRVNDSSSFVAMRYYDEVYANLDDIAALKTRSENI